MLSTSGPLRLLATASLLLLPVSASAFKAPWTSSPAPPPSTVRILVCGDSITQGAEFDFTWRYRLWEWFAAAHTTHPSTTPVLQYVGPYLGTLPNKSTPAPITISAADPSVPKTWGAYHASTSPAFASAHFAVYGRPAWQDIDRIGAQVGAHAPDVVVLHLGFNDIGWWGATAAELVGHVQLLVFNARVARPNVTLLIADVSHRLAVGGRGDIPVTTDAYNALLRGKVDEWTNEESRVLMVPVSEDYDCHVDTCPGGSDGLHPNALGDYQIARAYTRVLHDALGYGSGPLAVPPLESVLASLEATSFVAAPPPPPAPPTQMLSGPPPVGVVVGVGAACLVVVLALRRMRRRSGEGRYLRLPVSVEG